jgi:hypothetical protein
VERPNPLARSLLAGVGPSTGTPADSNCTFSFAALSILLYKK